MQNNGYRAVSSVEIVETKTNKTVDSFQLTDPEWAYVKPKGNSPERPSKQEHRPPQSHDFKFKARVKLEQ